MTRKRNEDRPYHERTDIDWHQMTLGLRGESKTGEKFALSLAGQPTKEQLRAVLALFAKENE